MEKFKFDWISSNGGPLVVMEQKHSIFWEGCDAPSNGRVVEAKSRWGLEMATDYDRACDIEDWIGMIQVGSGQAIVLSGDVLATIWFPLTENREGMLIRWDYGESESDVIIAAESLVTAEGIDEHFELIVEDTDLMLFDSAFSGNWETDPPIRFNLMPGKYDISTLEYQDSLTSIICHRFKSATSS